MSMNPPPPGAPPPPPGEDQPGRPPVPGHPAGGAPPPPAGPPPGYVPFGAAPPAAGQRTNGFAVASLVLGIVGIVLCFLWIPWILAIIFGAIAIKQCNEDPTYTGKGLAIAGLVCGLVGAAIIVLFLVSSGGDLTYDFGSVIVGLDPIR